MRVLQNIKIHMREEKAWPSTLLVCCFWKTVSSTEFISSSCLMYFVIKGLSYFNRKRRDPGGCSVNMIVYPCPR